MGKGRGNTPLGVPTHDRRTPPEESPPAPLDASYYVRPWIGGRGRGKARQGKARQGRENLRSLDGPACNATEVDSHAGGGLRPATLMSRQEEARQGKARQGKGR